MRKIVEKYKTVIICMVGIIIMTLSFNNGLFVIEGKERNKFKNFQLDSEDLVIGRIFRDKYKLNDNKYGLQRVQADKKISFEQVKQLLEENNDETVSTRDYKSQVGIQGTIFSFLYNKVHIPIKGLHCICSVLLAIVIVSICYLLKEKYGKLFSVIFYMGFLLSPWIVNFGRNLYWIEFTWFLPLLLCLLLKKTNKMKIFMPLVFLAVLFKCLCGYEYLSTILLTSISFLIVDFIIERDKRKENFKMIMTVGIISVMAFITAICIHAGLRGNGNIIQGFNAILKEDVMRRTISTNSEQWDRDLIKKSIDASYISVIKKYFQFNTDILYGIDGKIFMILCVFSGLVILINMIQKKQNGLRDLALYTVFLMGTLSWFILGKAHSYVHTHMNYVLWYFGYIQMSFYVIVKFVIEVINKYKEGEKTL